MAADVHLCRGISELYGHQNLDQFLSQRGANPRFKEAEDNFEKMAKVAGFIPKQLHDIRDDHETRNQLLNRAGSVVTQEIRRLWKDRPLKVRFHLDGPYLDTLISDPNAVYDVEVNLDERSRGFPGSLLSTSHLPPTPTEVTQMARCYYSTNPACTCTQNRKAIC